MGAARRARPWLAIVCLVQLVVSHAQGQNQTSSFITAGTAVCDDREAANDVLAIMRDPDEEVVPRLALILRSGGCSDRLTGEPYEIVDLEPSGIIKARLRTYLTVYLLPLTATPTDTSAPSTTRGVTLNQATRRAAGSFGS